MRAALTRVQIFDAAESERNDGNRALGRRSGARRRDFEGAERCEAMRSTSEDGCDGRKRAGWMRGGDRRYGSREDTTERVGGYADLARGPSPQPYMQENFKQGPSLRGADYNNNVPLHHQAAYDGGRY